MRPICSQQKHINYGCRHVSQAEMAKGSRRTAYTTSQLAVALCSDLGSRNLASLDNGEIASRLQQYVKHPISARDTLVRAPSTAIARHSARTHRHTDLRNARTRIDTRARTDMHGGKEAHRNTHPYGSAMPTPQELTFRWAP